MLALSEGLLLAVKSGIPRDVALDIMLSGVIALADAAVSRAADQSATARMRWFDCTMMQKDLELALELGEELGVPLPTASTTNAWLTIARGQGLAHYDFSVSVLRAGERRRRASSRSRRRDMTVGRDAAARRKRRRRDGRALAQARRRPGRGRRAAVRGRDRQGQHRDSVALSRRIARDPRSRRDDGPGRDAAGADRELRRRKRCTARGRICSRLCAGLAREHHVDLAQCAAADPADASRAPTCWRTSVQRRPRRPRRPRRRCRLPPAPASRSRRCAPRSPRTCALSKRTVADVFSVIEADMENVHAVRSAHGLTYLPFIARATVDALRAFPAVNARHRERRAGLQRRRCISGSRSTSTSADWWSR